MERNQVEIGKQYRYLLKSSKTGVILVDCIVEVVRHLSEEACRFKIVKVIKDDSGNGYYTYIHKTNKEENGSYKYLQEVEL